MLRATISLSISVSIKPPLRPTTLAAVSARITPIPIPFRFTFAGNGSQYCSRRLRHRCTVLPRPRPYSRQDGASPAGPTEFVRRQNALVPDPRSPQPPTLLNDFFYHIKRAWG